MNTTMYRDILDSLPTTNHHESYARLDAAIDRLGRHFRR